MRTHYHFIYFLILILFSSCADNNKPIISAESLVKLNGLHSGFNTEELTKELITLNKDTVTIVAFGHVYALQYHEDVFDSMIAAINAEDPDYVWILGDIVFDNTDEEWEYLLRKYKDLKGKRYHAGGNHDMNYHYERYHNINENQWEAETRFLKYVGYRYKSIEDDIANYMIINMNDSLERIKEYLDEMLPGLNPDKQSILFTHHSIWQNTRSHAEDPKTWVKKSFYKDSLLAEIKDFDYLIHGDWGGKLYKGTHRYDGHKFKVIGVGNLNDGDSLYISTIKLTKDDLWAYPTFIEIPDSSTWGEKIKD